MPIEPPSADGDIVETGPPHTGRGECVFPKMGFYIAFIVKSSQGENTMVSVGASGTCVDRT